MIGEEIKEKSIKELADRLNQIMVELNELDMEYNTIVRELWDRIPSLTNDPNLQLKRARGENERNNIEKIK